MADEIDLLIAADCTENQQNALTYEKWKDGIELRQPTIELVELVRLAKEVCRDEVRSTLIAMKSNADCYYAKGCGGGWADESNVIEKVAKRLSLTLD